MNDIVLSALVNLFALFGSRNGLDKNRSLTLITNYFKIFFGLRNPGSYVNLYTDLRDFYDEVPDLDKEGIVNGVCSNVKSLLKHEEQIALFLRLMEFCTYRDFDNEKSAPAFNPDDELYRLVARDFEISENAFSLCCDFIQEKSGEHIKIIELEGGAGKLKTWFVQRTNTLIFTYTGKENLLLDDIPLMRGVFQEWRPSSVLKSRIFSPIYYSTVMSLYGGKESSEKVELCGRNIEFRFKRGGDNGMHNFSFTLEKGQLVAIMGGSGVGKSTLLSLLNGNLEPQSGSVTINGWDVTSPEAKSLIGYVPQDDLLIEELTVYQNLFYTAKLCFASLDNDALDKKVTDILTQLGLLASKDLKVGSPINKFISGGQRKRLNIALELIREPAILFLDEPTSGLSSTDTEKVVNLLKEQSCKGRLVIANIHQPSSDVYRLFDRLWVLDRGGYPIYDGNPIDAISYFKTAANYADCDTSACPVCGNVTPEVILNILEEKKIDNKGKLTSERKMSPQQWHELYVKARPEMETPSKEAIPHTEQKHPGKFVQMLIFLKRNLHTKITNLQYILVTILEAPILALISAALTRFVPDSGVYTVMENKNMVSYFFMAVIVAIFLGMIGSAEEIIKDKALLKREKFLNLSYGSYIWSKIIYMGLVCLVQTFLFIIIGNSIMELHGLFWVWWAILFISAFLSSLIGLLLSQCLNSVVSIYISIPLLLIPQILLCGLVVDFSDLAPKSTTGNVPIIGDVIPSRWAFEALAVSNYSMNEYEKPLFEMDKAKYSDMYYADLYIWELQSRVELIKRDHELGIVAKDDDLAVLLEGLERLPEACDIDAYNGDDSVESVEEYLIQSKELLKKRSSKLTYAIDRQVRNMIDACKGRSDREKLDAYRTFQKKYCNNRLKDFVLNSGAEHPYLVVGSHIVPRCGYIYLTPLSHNGRAPFYSGVKVLGNLEIATLYFNIGVMILMCIILTICLLFNFPAFFERKMTWKVK